MMKRIGILSDTHSWLHPSVFDFFSSCDEIWHAGDAGNAKLLEQISEFRPLRAVYGNIDGQDVRIRCTEMQMFDCGTLRVVMMHIGGRPGKYSPQALAAFSKYRPRLFVCGHSHILKVQFDRKHNLLFLNPGAAGKYGLHQRITFVRMVIDGDEMKDLEVFDAPKHESAKPVG